MMDAVADSGGDMEQRALAAEARASEAFSRSQAVAGINRERKQHCLCTRGDAS